jgi:hypothetical protein
MSTKTGVAPERRIAFTVATKVNGVVATSSPGADVERDERQM